MIAARTIRAAFALSLLLACVIAIPSCQAVGFLAAVIDPPQKVKAVCDVPKDKKFLVLVEQVGQTSLDSAEPIKAELSKKIGQELIKAKVAGSVVDYDRLVDLQASDPDFAKRSIGGKDGVGQKLGADLVIYVKIDRFSLKDDPATPMWKGRLETTVKLVDVDKGRLWPKDELAGHHMRPVVTPVVEDPSPNYGAQVTVKLADEMGQSIVTLFHDHDQSLQEESKKDSEMKNL